MAVNISNSILRSNLRILTKARFVYQTSTLASNNMERRFECPCTSQVSSRFLTTKPFAIFKNFLDSYQFRSAFKKVGMLNVNKSVLRRNGYVIYEQVSDHFDYKLFFTRFNLPDTFNSWFLVMELHLWMILVRLMAEEEEGRFMRNCIIEAMWEDIREKTGLLGEEHITTARKQIKYLSEEFQAAILGYDEGILGDDVVLAGALWRRFFGKDCCEPEMVEDLVKYIRKQVKFFDSLSREEIMEGKQFKWFPVDTSPDKSN